MIRTFRDKTTAALFLGKPVKRLPPEIRKRAREKLDMIHNAHALEDLRVPPANRLEALSGDREGQYSIRINQQWRVCFRWENAEAFEVEVTDYH
ncbi:type II toxin-antitoxin system RelE/ParE family toxin [Halorhodospira neutriphila]|uniref:Plasmid maintenance system killer n=1 Tax=Halorhodospira neutriphila TaxID=168379 RepID=A0ABS1E3L6_9GAMM|nr:type II toxin-antitoxin system RelE/ParE family toxin [Halorhodospira neutriphila]MBK1726336.1 plasmid maintenance system killer [Halorhodospira neutriphila]